MPYVGNKILTVVQLGKLLAAEAGISEREATRILRAWGRVVTRVVLSGFGIPLGRSMRLHPKPLPARRQYNPVTREVEPLKARWRVTIDLSRKMREGLSELGEPTELDLKEFSERAVKF